MILIVVIALAALWLLNVILAGIATACSTVSVISATDRYPFRRRQAGVAAGSYTPTLVSRP